MKKKINFSLVYRDMWQSSGKYVPRVDQLKKIAPVIIDIGCFSRIETNGGAFEQVNLLYGENPNKAVREWTQPFNEAGIQTHMLERALNGIRMYPVPADLRKLMFQVKKAQGVDIARSFCGLNDHRNLELSVKYAKEAGIAKKRFWKELNQLKREKQYGPEKKKPAKDPNMKDITSPTMGRVFFNINYYMHERPIEVGTKIHKGERICYIEYNNTYDEIISDYEGEIDEIFCNQGDVVSKEDVLVRLK